MTLAKPVSATPAQLPSLGLLDTYSEQELRQLEFTVVGYGLSRTSKKGGPHALIDLATRMVAQQSLLSLEPTG